MKNFNSIIKLFSFILLTAISATTFGQAVSINATGTAPNAESILDISSTTKGVLLPRMTTGQRTSFTPTTTGMTVYDVTTESYWYWDDTTNAWQEIPNAGDLNNITVTLDAAYDDGGSGLGRTITGDAGAVEIIGTGGSVALETDGDIQLSEDQWLGLGSTIERIEFDGSLNRIDIEAADLTMDDGRWIGIDGSSPRIEFEDGSGRLNMQDADIQLDDAKWIGINASNPRILFEGGTTDRVTIEDADVRIDNNKWFGLGSTIERFEFQGSDGEVNLMGAEFGIGTLAPTEALDVNGQIRMRAGAAIGYIPVSNATGVMTWTDPTTIATADVTLDEAYDANGPGLGRTITADNGPVDIQGPAGLLVAGNVGIGTTDQTHRLVVNGTNSDTSPILSLRSGNDNGAFNNGAQIGLGYNGTTDYSHFIHTRHNSTGGVGNAIDFYLSDGSVAGNSVTSASVQVMTLAGTGNVGIGVTNPGSELEVDGKTTTTDFQMTNSPTNGFVLTSDATGNASWNDPASVIGTDTDVDDGLTVAYPDIDANVENGLQIVADDIVLGGSLNQATTIEQGNNAMVFDMTGTGDFEVQDNGSSALYIKDDGTVGINTNSPDASAILDVVSTSQGMLIPRMTFAQRNAIPSPANSLIIFNTTSGCLEIYADGAWQSFYCSCPVLDPLQSIVGPDPVCSGSTVNFSVPGVTGTATYAWTVSGVAPGSIVGDGGTSISFPAPASNTFTVDVVASNACFNSSSSQTTTVNAYTAVPPTPSSTGSPSAICQGGSYNYSIANGLGINGTGAIDYTWTVTVTGTASATLTANSQVATTGSPAVFTGTSTAITVNVGNTGSGNVSVSVVGNNTCGASSTALTWTLPVNTLSADPTSATASPTTICNGQSTTLALNGGGGGTNEVIRWYTSSCGGTLVGSGNGLSVSPTVTTTYYGRYEVPAPCSATTNCQSVTVTVNQPSVAPTSIAGAAAGCSGSSVILTAAGGTLGTGANYQWGTGSTVGSNIISGQTSATISVAPTTTTTYWVRIVNTSSPCASATAGVTVTLPINQPSVAPTNITGTTPLCSGDNTTLTAVGGTLGTGANYEWGTGAVVGSNIIAGQTASTISVSPTSTTIYWVRIVNTTSPCAATTSGVTLTITVNQPSVAPTSISSTSGSACLGSSTTLTAVGGTLGTGANYEWGTGSVVGSNVIVGQTGIALSVSPTTTTTYWVRIVNGTAPCAAATSGVTTTLSINQPSVAPTNITGTTPLCVGDNTTLTAVGGTLGTGANYQWGTGAVVGSNIIAGQTASTISVSPTSTTTYWVRIVNTASPCTATTAGVTLTITVNQPSVAPTSITGGPTLCNGNPITLTAAGGTLGTGSNYQWGTGSVVGTNPIVGQTGITLTVSPVSNTTYWVRIENGTAPCSSTTAGVSQLITVNNPSTAPTSIAGTSTICSGSSVVLTANGGTLGTGANYQWGTGTTVGNNVIPGETAQTYSPSPTSTTSYWVRIVNTDSPCTANTGGVTTTITVNQPSTAPTSISGTTPICNGDPVTLTAVGGTLGTGANYQWGTGGTIGSNIIGGAVSSTYTPSPTSNTTYWVRIVNTSSPCTAVTGGVTRTITVDNFTTANAGSDQSLCATTATLAANSPSTGNGSWSVISGSGSFSSTSSPTATVSSLGIGANTFRWTLANGACADSQDDVVINASAPLSAPTSVTASPSSIINGQTSNLSATSSGDIAWYTAASGGAPIGSSSSGANFPVTPTATTTYYAESQPPSTIAYNETFISGSTPTTQATNWCSFRSQLLSSYSYTGLTVSSEYGSVTITDPAAVLGIANALRTGSTYSVNVGGNTWYVGTGCVAGSSPCGGTAVTLAMNWANNCTCGSGMFVIRPEINNPNWGGVGTAHCGGLSQTINVVFSYEPVGCPSTTRTPVTVTVTQPPAACTHSISLYDTYGDGWHGNNFVTVRVNGTVVGTYTMSGGCCSTFGPQQFNFQAADGDAIQVTYSSGSWAGECYYTVRSGNNTNLVTNWFPNSSGTWNGTADCP